MYSIILREGWGAQHDNGSGPASLPARELWLHHSVTVAPDLVPPYDDDYAAMRTLERIGENRFGRGVSYTFVVTPAGLIFEGHGVNRRGSHTYGRNSIARAICLLGNYEADDLPIPMRDSAAWLMAHGFLSGWWDAVSLDGGHRDVRQTACPGRFAYAAIPELNARAKAHADGVIYGPSPAPTPQPVPSDPSTYPRDGAMWWPTLSIDDRNYKPIHTSIIQQVTGAVVDGWFGRSTRAAVQAYQRGHGLGNDGIVGKATGTLIVQNVLRDLQCYGGALDGRYGPQTSIAVAKLQAFAGITVDGNCGDRTTDALWFFTPKG